MSNKLQALIFKVFKSSPVKKMKRSEFDKYLKVAFNIAIIDVADNLAKDHKKHAYLTAEEVIGQLSILAQRSEKKINLSQNNVHVVTKPLDTYI